MCCLVSESLVSVAGQDNGLKPTAKITQEWLRDTWDYSEVAYYEPRPKSDWTSLEGANICHLEKTTFKPEVTEAICSQGVHWQLQKLIANDCLKNCATKYQHKGTIIYVQACFISLLLNCCSTESLKKIIDFYCFFPPSNYLSFITLLVWSYFSDHVFFINWAVPIILSTCESVPL